MRINVCPNFEEGQDTYTLEVSGDLDVNTAPTLSSQLRSPLTVNRVDLTRCSFIDSQGIGVLVYYARKKRERNEPFEVLIRPNLAKTLSICGFGLVCNLTIKKEETH